MSYKMYQTTYEALQTIGDTNRLQRDEKHSSCYPNCLIDKTS